MNNNPKVKYFKVFLKNAKNCKNCKNNQIIIIPGQWMTRRVMTGEPTA